MTKDAHTLARPQGGGDADAFRTLADDLNVGILVHRRFKPLYANQAMLDLSQFETLADVLALDGTDTLIAERSRAIYRERHQARLRGESPPSDYIVEARRRDGTAIWINNRPTVIDWMGEPAICSCIIDVTERVQGEDALARSELRYRHLFANAAEGLFRVNADGHLTEANPALARMLGYDRPQDLMGPTGIRAEAVFRDAEDHRRLARHLLDGGNLDRERVCWRRKDGTPVWVQLTMRPVGAVEGEETDPSEPNAFDGLAVDVSGWRNTQTDLIRAKEQADLANRAKSDFLAHMSHELRTPLNCISGFSQVLMGEMFGPLGHPNYREYVGDIHTSGMHLLNVISDILDISKIEAGELDIIDGELDPAEVVLNCMKMMRERSDRAQVIVSTSVPANLPRLRADELRIKQILLNLLSNAVKYTPPGGRISASADIDDAGRMVFVVADTGIGIEPADMAKVLAPFEQVRENQTLASEGTGLGVYLSRVLTELHGGTLSIDSKPGAGTKVTVTLPAGRVVPLAEARGDSAANA
ncbi:MAG: ATP-binding protein [Rhodospirillaceae bacterium]